MSAASVKKIWLTAAILFLGAVISLYWSNVRLEQSLRGNLVFSDNAGNIPEFSKIVISRPDNVITVYKDDIVWRVAEADNYYADFNLMRSLTDAVSSAHIGSEAVSVAIDKED